jgi:glycosyltransferase involved in cell wall biosynthesis
VSEATAELVVDLDRPLPASLPVGTATAIFCLGTCFHPDEELDDLELVADGIRHRPAAFGMPRPDRPRVRSGFWATIPIEPCDRTGAIELRVAARLASGLELAAPLGRIEVVEPEAPRVVEPVPERAGPGLIAVCMATFEPDPALFATQIESLRAQTDDRWVCVVSDDCSGPEHFERIEEAVGSDPRFVLSRSETRLGFYRNFERALQMAPREAELLALCDQDDRWHPEKLMTLRAALGDAQLVYSDQRLVDASGRVLRDTLWKGRRNNSTNLVSVLIANTITGAATLFRREVAELALPFPDSPGFQFHDHWLAVVALAAGDVAYVDRPLYDYVQHAGAVFGDVTSGDQPPRSRPSIRRWWEALRAAYFYGYLSREVQAQTALLRCPARLSPGKRRALQRFVASAHSPAAFAWLTMRPLRELLGRNETLGSEAAMAAGILWKAVVAARAKRARTTRRLRGDARFPPPSSFNQKRLRRWRARV